MSLSIFVFKYLAVINVFVFQVHLATDKKPELEIDVDKDKMLLRLFIHFPKDMSQDELRNYFSVSFCCLLNLISLYVSKFASCGC